MLTTTADLSSLSLSAGEPFLLEVQFLDKDGAVVDPAARAFVLTFFLGGADTGKAINGELLTDETGKFVRFARSGTFFEASGGTTFSVELTERFREGRNVTAAGRLTVAASAPGIASLDNAAIGRFVTRISIRDAQALGAPPIFSQANRLFRTDLGTPLPRFTTLPSLSHDGSPQVGEEISGVDGVIADGVVKARQWLLNGSAISGATGAKYVPIPADVGKALAFRVTATGGGVDVAEATSGVLIAAATGTPTPTPTPTPTIAFDQPTLSAAEGNSGTKTLTMTVVRSSAAGALAVTATFVQGSAGAADFAGNALPGNKVFTFADGVASATATVGISGDTDVESDETFGYQLVATSGYTLGSPSSITGTVLNDDTAPTPTVSLTAATASRAEGAAGTTYAWVYTVTRSSGTGTAVVPWTFAAGGTDASDWSGATLPAGGNVSFAAGETSKTFSVMSAGDSTVEPDETFTVTIAAPSGYVVSGSASATGTILNDDAASAPIVVSAWPYSDDFEDAATGADAMARPNWASVGAAPTTWKVSAAKSMFNSQFFRGATYAMFGPVLDDDFGFEIELDENRAGNNDPWESSRQWLSLFFRDANNHLQMQGGFQGRTGVDQVVNGGTGTGVNTNFGPGLVVAPPADPAASYRRTYQYHAGKLRMRGGHDEWMLVATNRYAYPTDITAIDAITGLTDPANRKGRVAWQSNTWGYDTVNGIRMRPLKMVITSQTRYCSRSVQGGTSGLIRLSGDYKGTPTRWAYRLRSVPAPKTLVQDWRDCTSVTAANGAFTVKCEIPVGGPYEIELAMVDADGTTHNTFSKRVMCGRFYLTYGQSNSYGRGANASDAAKVTATNNPKTAAEARPTNGAPTGLPGYEVTGMGTAEFGNGGCNVELSRIVAEQTGEPCLCLSAGFNGAPISYVMGDGFTDARADASGNGFVAARGFIEGIVDGVLWDQGEGDADGVSATSDYGTQLIAGYDKMVTATGNPNLPMWISPIGRYSRSGNLGANDKTYTAQDEARRSIKLGYEQAIAARPGRIMYSDSKLGIDHGADPYHYTPGGYDEACRRAGWTIAKSLGVNTHDGRGPIPTGITRAGAVITVAIDLNGATGLTDLVTRSTATGDAAGTAPLTGLYGYQVSKDNFATTLTISSIVRSGATLVITLAADPGAAVKLRSFHGSSYDDRQLFWGAMSTGENIPVFPITNYLTSN